MQWKDFVKEVVEQHCQITGSKTFTLQELLAANGTKFKNFSANNHHPFDKVRQMLQVLRDENSLDFVDNKGTYKLK